MTKDHASEHPETGGEALDRQWALRASLAISTFGIAFSLVAWVWANGQRVEYTNLQLVDMGSRSGVIYFPVYLASMFLLGVLSLGLAGAGVRASRSRPWVGVAAGAMAMFLVMVPVVTYVGYEVSHWGGYPGD